MLREKLGNLARVQSPMRAQDVCGFPRYKRFYDNRTGTFVYYEKVCGSKNWTTSLLWLANLAVFGFGIIIGRRLAK